MLTVQSQRRLKAESNQFHSRAFQCHQLTRLLDFGLSGETGGMENIHKHWIAASTEGGSVQQVSKKKISRLLTPCHKVAVIP